MSDLRHLRHTLTAADEAGVAACRLGPLTLYGNRYLANHTDADRSLQGDVSPAARRFVRSLKYFGQQLTETDVRPKRVGNRRRRWRQLCNAMS